MKRRKRRPSHLPIMTPTGNEQGDERTRVYPLSTSREFIAALLQDIHDAGIKIAPTPDGKVMYWPKSAPRNIVDRIKQAKPHLLEMFTGPKHAESLSCWCVPELVQHCWQCHGKCVLRVVAQTDDGEQVLNLPCGLCEGRGVLASYDPARPAFAWHR